MSLKNFFGDASFSPCGDIIYTCAKAGKIQDEQLLLHNYYS